MSLAKQSPIWSVSGLCAAIAQALDNSWPPLQVSGEISNFVLSANGHAYFSLKDSSAQIRCVMFKRSLAGLSFRPGNGQAVELRAKLSLYQARGDLQLVVESMAQPQAGQLYAAFLQLKAKLQAEGLFDSRHKRPIPAYPSRLGLVTSVAGAVQHDVQQTLARRAPHVHLVFSPASVQGSSAAAELCAALQALYQQPLDAIILARGGGSIEDLHAFNDEALARTIAASPVPIISGVGHESDYTIADFVADLRAATPTAAAELATPHPRDALLSELNAMQQWLHRKINTHIQQGQQWLDHSHNRLLQNQRHHTRQQRSQLQQCQQRLQLALQHRLHQAQQQLTNQTQRLAPAARRVPQQAQHHLQQLSWQLQRSASHHLQQQRQRLQSHSQRLFALQQAAGSQRVPLLRPDGLAVHQLADVQLGQTLTAHLSDGRLQLQVLAQTPHNKKPAKAGS